MHTRLRNYLKYMIFAPTPSWVQRRNAGPRQHMSGKHRLWLQSIRVPLQPCQTQADFACTHNAHETDSKMYSTFVASFVPQASTDFGDSDANREPVPCMQYLFRDVRITIDERAFREPAENQLHARSHHNCRCDTSTFLDLALYMIFIVMFMLRPSFHSGARVCSEACIRYGEQKCSSRRHVEGGQMLTSGGV